MTTDPYLRPADPVLEPALVREAILRFLAEDVGRGDVTTQRVVPPGGSGARSDGTGGGKAATGDASNTVFVSPAPTGPEAEFDYRARDSREQLGLR